MEENLNERALGEGKEHGGAATHNADPIWTWNAPEFLTGDFHGTSVDFGPADNSERPRAVGERLTLKEKVQNVRDHFASLEEYERRKGGRTHYRIILSFDVPATNRQIRDLTNKLLGSVFPKAIAFGAIHRDTDHPHVHLYLNSRQFDGKRIQLKNDEFKTIDENWARIYSDFAGDKSVYVSPRCPYGALDPTSHSFLVMNWSTGTPDWRTLSFRKNGSLSSAITCRFRSV